MDKSSFFYSAFSLLNYSSKPQFGLYVAILVFPNDENFHPVGICPNVLSIGNTRSPLNMTATITPYRCMMYSTEDGYSVLIVTEKETVASIARNLLQRSVLQ